MFEEHDSAAARPLWLVAEGDLDGWLATQDEATRAWLGALRFRGERHQVACLAGGDGAVRAAVLGLGPLASAADLEPWHLAGAVERLPGGAWQIATPLPAAAATAAALGWAHGSYRFERYRSKPRRRLSGGAGAATTRRHDATCGAWPRRCAMARDLINTPAADLSPARARR